MNILPALLMILSVVLFSSAVVKAFLVFLYKIGVRKVQISDIKIKLPAIPDDKKVITEIIFYCVISRVAIYLIGILGFMLVKNQHIGFMQSFSSLFVKWDGEHYPFIAQNWYVNYGDKKYLLVFFPLYPVVIRIVALFVQNYIAASFIVSNVSLVIGCIYLYKITEMDFDRDCALRTVKYFLIFPVSFFLSSSFSESMFFAITVAAIYYWRKKDFRICALLALMGSLTRSFGILLVVPMLVDTIIDFKKNGCFSKSEVLERLYAFISPFLGILCYLIINYRVSGSAFTFLKYQKEHWSQSIGFFGSTISTLTRNCYTDTVSQVSSLWIPQIIIIFMVLIVLFSAIKHLNIGYVAYMIAYIFLTISATWLLSAPRYLMCLFPLLMAMGNMGKNRYIDYAITLMMAVGLGFCTIAFVNGYYIM